ncbi:MAG: SusF/SusE family outer membrane protein [Candidatus Symbiothrix sp.]|jgi:hypothetical protein|nr:SusF/SusE family outer membrane protein [Candidatus Symbiothrix sp.]
MKNKIKYMLPAMLFLFAGCQDEPEHYVLETPEDTMHLSVSAEEITLNADKENEEAVSFTWNEAANRGAGAKLTYWFKMDIADNNFETSIAKMEIPAGVKTIGFTHKELNDMLMEWNIEAGRTIRLQTEVIAEVSNTNKYMKPEISTTELNVTGYAIGPNVGNIWLTGSATSAGWQTPFSLKMTESATTIGIFTWEGNLTVGELKFPLSATQGYECDYLMPKNVDGNNLAPLSATAMKYVAYRTEDMPDHKWQVLEGQSGKYIITVDTRKMTVKFDKQSAPVIPDDLPYKKIWLTGDATPAGWTYPFYLEMTYDMSAVKGAFVWEGPLTAGELKFPLDNADNNWNHDYLMPKNVGSDNLATLSETNVEFVANGGPDKKWKVSTIEAGNYKISMNVISMTIKFEKQ